ncbi:MAG: hypothetical protein CMH81_02615 [Nitrospiraceae bacterium]|nr:hypothetical protein [Nitrospiraceae bacterium]
MSDHRATNRYADAIYQLAKEKGEESLWNEELGKAMAVLHSTKVVQILSHPKLDLSKKWDVLESFFGDGRAIPLRKPTLNLVKLLLQNHRISLIAAIREKFQVFWERDQGTVSVRLTTAVSLTSEEQGTMKAILEASLGKTVRLDQIVDLSILGGAVIQIEDQMIDGSLQAKMRIMREELVA